MPDIALILYSHGSLLCGAAQYLQDHAETIRKSGEFVAVEVAFLNYVEPTLEMATAACRSAGATTIVTVPYFLVAGKFVTQDLPAQISKLANVDIPIKLARAIEDAPEMLDAVLESEGSAEPLDTWQANAIRQVYEACSLRKDCPLYGTPACRAGDGKAL